MTNGINRRKFLGTTLAAGAGLWATRGLAADAADAADAAEIGAEIGAGKRVGLIGTGWYGKCDLLRLLQVSPVNVISLCDVDRTLLKEAGDIDEGKLGTIGHIELCSYYHMRVRNAPPNEAPPAGLDWDMWCGPAPKLPFNKRIHPRGWRSFREFGNGIVGDMCIHMLDTVRWMLDLGWPKTIFSSGGTYVDKESIASVPDTQTAVFSFGNLNAIWTHRTWGNPVDKDFPWSAIIYGEKGTLKLSVHRYEWIPRKGDPVRREVTLELDQFPVDKDEKGLEKHVAPAIRGHMRDWLRCVENRGKPIADIEQGYTSSASCILANVSNDLGRSLAFDSETTRIIGDDDANKHLQRPYRAPWIHPAAS